MKRLLTIFLAIISIFCLMLATSCSNEGSDTTKTNQIKSIYNVYVAYAEGNGEQPLSYDTWLASIKGEKGDQGIQGITGNGISGIQKVSSQNGIDTYKITFTDNSFFEFSLTNGKDGKNGEDGKDGKNIELRVDNATNYIQWKYTTDTNWTNLMPISDLKPADGKDGKDGKDGEDGQNGIDGLTPYIGTNGNWWIGTFDTGVVVDLSKTDDRILTLESNGLIYITMTIGGKSGYVVSDWIDEYLESEYVDIDHIDELNIVIPNYIGNVPVIGVLSEAFKGDTHLKSISLSKNTVYLEAQCFSGCTALETVDFNDCELTMIPSKCFYESNIKDITLPSKVTKLGVNAFGNCSIENINYENITYFGEGCLNKIETNYVYLKNNVEYVGKQAFNSIFVYTENDTIPTTWGSQYLKIQTKIKQDGDYLYSTNSSNVTVYKYLGNNTIINIPSQIKGQNVTTIGYGFCSVTNTDIEKIEDCEDIKEFKQFDKIVIPNTVTKIDEYALLTVDTMIYIPSSVTDMWYATGWLWFSDDDWISYSSSYLAFESSQLPNNIFFIENDGTETSWKTNYEQNVIGENLIRYSLNNDFSKIVYDETTKTYYTIKNDNEYNLLAVMSGCGENLVLSAVYNDKTVNTILSFAVANISNIKSVKITGAYTRIRANAFNRLVNCQYVFINKNVEIVNANAFYDCGINYFVEEIDKPLDWDSSWIGDKSTSTKINYSIKDVSTNDEYIYCVDTLNRVSLVKYLKTLVVESIVNVPTKIDNKTVYRIMSNCIETSDNSATGTQSKFLFYIPSTITNIEEKGIYLKNYNTAYATIYTDAPSKPEGWVTNYICTSGYNNGSSQFNIVFDRFADGNNIYKKVGSDIVLTNYVGDTNKLIIVPSTVNGENVNKIESGYISTSHALKIIISTDIENLEGNAIKTTSGAIDVYIETDSIPTNWNDYGCCYYYNYNSYGFNQWNVSVHYGSTWELAGGEIVNK